MFVHKLVFLPENLVSFIVSLIHGFVLGSTISIYIGKGKIMKLAWKRLFWQVCLFLTWPLEVPGIISPNIDCYCWQFWVVVVLTNKELNMCCMLHMTVTRWYRLPYLYIRCPETFEHALNMIKQKQRQNKSNIPGFIAFNHICRLPLLLKQSTI